MLRLLVVVLLVANAAYFAWAQGYLQSQGLAPQGESEPQRLEQQLQPQGLRILSPSESRAKVAAAAPEPQAADELQLDPLWQRTPLWRGQRINLPLTAQRILATLVQRAGQVVSYDELFDVVKSGRNRDNVRKHVSTIRDAFRDVDPTFDGIENVPMRGFRWVAPRRHTA